MECNEEQHAVMSVINTLACRFPGRARTDIEDAVCEEYSAFNSGQVRTMVPVLVERAASQRLLGNRV